MNKKNVLALALVTMMAWVGKPAMAASGTNAFDPVEYAMPLMGPPLGYELLDATDRKDGRRMAVYLYGK